MALFYRPAPAAKTPVDKFGFGDNRIGPDPSVKPLPQQIDGLN